MTLAERLRQEGHKRGREEGREEGQRAVLLKLLRLRFGELPESAETSVRAAGLAELDQMAERVLTAQTLDEALREA